MSNHKISKNNYETNKNHKIICNIYKNHENHENH